MIFTPLELEGAYLIDPEPHADERGSFARVFCAETFAAHGLVDRFVQTSVSHNARRGVLRGLHFQTAPHQETKLIRCVAGEAFDVIVDLRPGSPTFRKWASFEISAQNRRMVYAPQGFAHGFLTLTEGTELEYQITPAYAAGSACGVRWNDPAFAIDWPEPPDLIISERDAAWPLVEA
jgi:dTDP-4-dehydrorhamnose 3,5-epimerase